MNDGNKMTESTGQKVAELQRSFDAFSEKVEQNYRAFYSESPPVGDHQRNLLQLWLIRCGLIQSPSKKRKP